MNANFVTEHRSGADLIVAILRKNGYAAYFAGGFVRDLVLEVTEKGDIDIATNAKPQTIAQLFPATIDVGEQFGVMVVVLHGYNYEVATFRSDIGIHDGRHPSKVVFTDAQTDALRRDFTINGMFYDPQTDEIIDFVNGIDDCNNGIIRSIGDPQLRFREDFLRMLRAIRFSSRFNFSIEQQTWNAIVENAAHITEISPERIYAEINRMLCGNNPDKAIELLDKSGMLKSILPEVSSLSGVEQPPEFHPEGDVFVHTLKALHYLRKNPSPILAWSTLLHDIGKPPTITYKDRIRFNNHDRVGATMAITVLKRLRASNAVIEGVDACISNHMNFMNVTRMRLSNLKKFLARPTLQDELELHRVDCLASHGDISNCAFIEEQLQKHPAETIKPPPVLTGKDLIALGLKPGPEFGKILTAAYDLQLEDQIRDKDEAIAFVQEWITENR
ncbi:MAG TPA: CCA tRNA nucleotidyltransferase [Chitinispirillaceae bacterium]|nr:CCA tRNA nucleotidyltransferase [Chitinispirillaceae bacterium]